MYHLCSGKLKFVFFQCVHNFGLHALFVFGGKVMGKKIGKILFITLAVMLLLTVVGLSSAFAETYTEGYYTYSVENGESTITDVDEGISGDITIPATLGGYPVTSIGEPAFIDCQYIESIQLPKSLKNIAPWAFAGCLNLKRITIPNSVTNIGSWAFAGCISLESIIIPDAVTNIPEYTFSLCLNLNSITLPASITYIEKNAFDDCENLEDVYYTGTIAQWQKIDIDSYNDYLTSATIHYNHCDHKYSNSCDKTCNICGATRTITHTYKTTTTMQHLLQTEKQKQYVQSAVMSRQIRFCIHLKHLPFRQQALHITAM